MGLVVCFPKFNSWFTGFLVINDQHRNSARFRAGECPTPYPRHYSTAFAFSSFLYPHPLYLPYGWPTPSLCVQDQNWRGEVRAYHVPFLQTEWVRFRLSTDGATSVRQYSNNQPSWPFAFWLQQQDPKGLTVPFAVLLLRCLSAVHIR